MLPGYAMLLAASLFWSLAILVTRRYPPRRPVLDLLPWCFALASLLLLPLALLARAGGAGIGAAAWPHAAFIGAVAAPIGTWATIEAGRRLSGIVASVGFLAMPALGVPSRTSGWASRWAGTCWWAAAADPGGVVLRRAARRDGGRCG